MKILGYTNNMDDLMKLSNVMVTKPGGITLSEALAVQVPLILYRSVPGQERENALFFEQKGACINVDSPDSLIETITNLISQEQMQTTMKENMKSLYHPHAAKVICDDVRNMLEEQKEKRIKEII